MHEIGYAECSKSYVFRGNKDYTQKQIQDMLGLSPSANRAAPRPGQPMPPQGFGAARFLMPVQQCEFQLTGILESLAREYPAQGNDEGAISPRSVVVEDIKQVRASRKVTEYPVPVIQWGDLPLAKY